MLVNGGTENAVTYSELNDSGERIDELITLLGKAVLKDCRAICDSSLRIRWYVEGSALSYRPGDRVDIDGDSEVGGVRNGDKGPQSPIASYSAISTASLNMITSNSRMRPRTSSSIASRPSLHACRENGNVTLVDGGYIAGTLTTITVTADKGSGTDIDFTANETAISLTAEDGTELSGATTLQGTTLTLTLGNPLDTRGENGTYTLVLYHR